MTEKTRTGLILLPVAVGIGALGDALLRTAPWGVNLFLWLLLSVGALGIARRRLGISAPGEGQWLAVPALILAIGVVWRDSNTLGVLDVLGILACLLVGAARTRAGQVRVGGVLDGLADSLWTGFQSAFGVFGLLRRDVDWAAVPRTGWLPRLVAVGRGLLLALPLLLLFGGLLSGADAVFGHLLGTALHLNTEALLGHLFWTVLAAWLAAGFGRALLLADPPVRTGERRPNAPVLGVWETNIILGLLNLLFAAFVLVQIRYFFGGAATLQATAGLTYAQYARSGFFQLVWVAALVLPLLLLLHGLQRPEDARGKRLFSMQAGGQVALLFVIMASALARMRLYGNEYGLTELRLYTTAFMVWLAAVFIWFVLTVLRGQREHFAFDAALTAFCVVASLHLINPDALIVRVNLAHARQGHTFDADYALSLSADAAPALAAALPSLPPDARQTVAWSLLQAWSGPADWRSWSVARAQAARAVQSRLPALREAVKEMPACGCTEKSQ